VETKAERKAREASNFFKMFLFVSIFLYIAGMIVLSMYATTILEYGVLLIYLGAVLIFATMVGLIFCVLQEEFGIIKKALKIECPEK